jgi:hypothetical protein
MRDGDNHRRIKLTSKFSRSALIAALAVGASGLVAVSADAATVGGITGTQTPGYVNQPVVNQATQVTPESAVITGAIDTGGYTAGYDVFGTGYTVNSPTSTWDGGVAGTGIPVTPGPIQLDGLPLSTPVLTAAGATQQLTYSSVWVEYDPLSDYEASGDVPGPKTQFAPEEDVDTSANPYSSFPAITIGGYPAANAEANAQSPLTPGTQYVYWVEQQVGETTAATTINEFDPVDLYYFLGGAPAGSGAVPGTGDNTASGAADGAFVSASAAKTLSWSTGFTSENDEAAWQADTGIYGANALGAANLALFAGKVAYTTSANASGTLNLTNLANPDWQCAADATINATNTTGEPWAQYSDAGTLTGGISSFASGALTYAGAEPDFQGASSSSASCVDFLGGTANQNYFVTSATGEFTTPKLGKVVFGAKAKVAGKYATDTVKNESSLDARGTVELTAKVGKKKGVEIASGTFKVAASGSTTFNLKLTPKGVSALNTDSKLAGTIVYTSATDQPSSSKSIKL